MCGIVAILDRTGDRSPGKHALKRMLELMQHRGPDQEGAYHKGSVALGARRLKVIDLEGSRQPATNEDGSIHVVFNGEIYNYRQLRQELTARGHRLTEKGDTEVLVHLYEQHGLDMLKHLNGMFAFALWDERRKELFLARDRIGIKPLYYYLDDELFIASSSLQAMLLCLDIPLEIDPNALAQYLMFEYNLAPLTIINRIRKLAPGHYLRVGGDSMDSGCYWQPELSEEVGFLGMKEAAMRLTDLLASSLEMQSISDAPLGILLSGGLDSGSLLAMLHRIGCRGIQAFTIGFKDQQFDESSNAKAVAERFEAKLHLEYLTEKNLLELVPAAMDCLEEPLADASIIPTYLVCKTARQLMTAALAGDGGDELFAGYRTHRAHLIARMLEGRDLFFSLVSRLVQHKSDKSQEFSLVFKLRKFLKGMRYPPSLRNQAWWGAYDLEELAEALLPQVAVTLDAWSWLAPSCFYTSLSPHSSPPSSGGRKRMGCLKPQASFPFIPLKFGGDKEVGIHRASSLNHILWQDLRCYLANDLLPKVDMMSMANSLEVRVPYLDHRIVEFMFSLPSSYKLRLLGRSKRILRHAMRDRLPKSVLKGGKRGFDVPLGRWLRGKLFDFAQDWLFGSNLISSEFINPSFVRRIIDEHNKGIRNNRQLIWTLIVLNYWHERILTIREKGVRLWE